MQDRKKEQEELKPNNDVLNLFEFLSKPIKPEDCRYKKEQAYSAAIWWANHLAPYINSPEKQKIFGRKLAEEIWQFCQLPSLNIEGNPNILIALNGRLIQSVLKDTNIVLKDNKEMNDAGVYICQNGDVRYYTSEYSGRIYETTNPTPGMKALEELLNQPHMSEFLKLKDNLTIENILHIDTPEKKLELSDEKKPEKKPELPATDSTTNLVKTGIFKTTLPEIKASPEKMKSNLNNLYCDKSIFNGQDEVIYGLAKSGNMIFTSSSNSIFAWNATTGEKIWQLEGSYNFKEKIWIRDGKLICADKDIIMLLDLKTGKQLAKIDASIDLDLITIAGTKIFSKLNNQQIIQSWDVSDLKQTEQFPTLTKHIIMDDLLVNDQFIVHSNHDRSLTIINRENKKTVLFTIPESYRDLSHPILQNDLLICGISGVDPKRPDIFIIDLNKAEIVDTYRIKIHERYPRDGSVNSIAAHGNHIFFANNLGEVYAIDLKNKTHQLLEDVSDYAMTKFAIKDNLLFILTQVNRSHLSQVAIWDLDKMERMQTIELTAAHDLLWDKGNLFVAFERSLVRYNFNVPHQEKERLLEGSPAEPDYALRTGDCIIL